MSTHTDDLRIETRSVHAGQKPDPSTGSVWTPIYQTSTYVQEAPGKHKGYEYSRVSNPTRTALEGNLASLENAEYGICFASGVAGIEAILKSLKPGDHIVSTNDLYGGTYRLFKNVFEEWGLSFTFVEMTDINAVEEAITDETVMLWAETPTNPLLRISDIKRMAELAKAFDCDLAVDNTFATPYLQQPLLLGADLVLHSATKYLGGHSDLILGAVCTNNQKWADDLRFQIKCGGAAPGPMDCFLALRGTKTLHLRMKQHCENARRIAEYLTEHPGVGQVYYPGLQQNPGYEVASDQMRDFGGMVSITLAEDTVDEARTVITNTEVFQLAESLGGVESLIEHPATMTHASMPPEERRKAGFKDSLIRLSVGVENGDDLLKDLDVALSKLD